MFKQIFIDLCNKRNESPSSVCRKVGITPATFSGYTDESVPRQATLMRIADYFGVSVDYLLGREEKSPVSPAVTTEDAELIEYLEELKTRPEMRMLFSLSKNATKEDVEDAVRIIEALRKGRNS